MIELIKSDNWAERRCAEFVLFSIASDLHKNANEYNEFFDFVSGSFSADDAQTRTHKYFKWKKWANNLGP